MTTGSSALRAELEAAIGKAAVVADPADMAAFTEDWRGRSRGPAACVVLPSSTEQVSAAVRICAAHGVPMLPQGGNTSLCGGAVPRADGAPPVMISLSRMRRIRALDPVNNTITVDAGCVLAAVHEAAAEAGRFYPVSLGAEGSCQIGGNIATNAGGTGVLRYGNTRENVLGLEAVLPDGSVWNGLNGLRKNNTGYDFKHLFIGSEGTLGVITGAVLKLHPLPDAFSVAWLAVDGPEAALDMLGRFQSACGSRLSAFELINADEVRMVLEHLPDRRCPVADVESWHVLVELSDTDAPEVLAAAMESVLADALEDGVLRDAVIAASEAQRAAMWLTRHSVSEANKKGGIGLSSDTAVPVSAIPAFIRDATRAVHAVVPGLPILVVGHMGDGNVHFIPFFPFSEWEALADRDTVTERLRHAVNDAAVALGGTFSAEHGVGQSLVGEMARYKSATEIALMQALRRTLDPAGLFNPGRLLPPE